MDAVFLEHPKKSHRKVIEIPSESACLAEFIGIEFGDGGIGNPWQVVITVNSEQDKKYAGYVVNLIEKLFGLEPRVWKRKGKKALLIVSSSTSLVDFLVSKGVVRGNKIAQNFDVPEWISGRSTYERAFVRGLIDTDGCLFIHRHSLNGVLYRNIGLCFYSGSRRLLSSVAEIFRKNHIEPHISGKKIYLYKDASKWVEKIIDIFNKGEEFRHEFGKKASQFVIENYSWEKISKRYLEEIEKLVQK